MLDVFKVGMVTHVITTFEYITYVQTTETMMKSLNVEM